MKLGKKYVAAILALTALAVVGVYVLEDHNQRWVLAHPVLDGAIGGAIIIPITGVIALAIIDGRLDALAQREKDTQAELVLDRLGAALRQSIRAAFYNIGLEAHQQVEGMDVHALRCFAKEIRTLDRPPTLTELRRIDDVLALYTQRAISLMDQLVALTHNERARGFSAFISDGLDFVVLGVRLPKGTESRPGTFWLTYASLAELLVNAAAELCPTALPLDRMARTEPHDEESPAT